MKQPSNSRLQSIQIRLITATCLGLAGAVVFIILYWILSGSLEDIETPFAGIIFILILAGIAWIARRGGVTLSAWMLTGLLSLLITADLVEYGVTTPAASSYVIPILLAAFCMGLWPALGLAAFGSAAGWMIAWAQTSSVYTQPPADISQLTFNAPILTVILLITGLMAGYWGRNTSQLSDKPN